MTPFVRSSSAVHLYDLHSRKYVNKSNNKITELRAILQRESQNS